MKKSIDIGGKILLFSILFILGTTNICLADLYTSPQEMFMMYYGDFIYSFIFTIEAILAVLFIISLICIIIGRIGKIDELLSKSKKVCENLFYYFIIIIGLAFAIFVFAMLEPYHIISRFSWDDFYWLIPIFLAGTLPLIFTILSLFFRLKSKNKRISYITLGIYLILAIFLKIVGF